MNGLTVGRRHPACDTTDETEGRLPACLSRGSGTTVSFTRRRQDARAPSPG